MSSERDGLARSVQVRLTRYAKEMGADTNLVLMRFAVERFLYRLSRSEHAERFVLKGALLMFARLGNTLRPTRDADLLGFGELTDVALADIVRNICETTVTPDAIIFLTETIVVEPIRAEDAYGGQRVTLVAMLGAARLRVQVDVGIGDAVIPPPTWLDYPGLLDDLPQPRLRAYATETVVAEKFHAIVTLGLRNSRLKDYFDLYAIARAGGISSQTMGDAIAATFERRRTPLPTQTPVGLSDTFAQDPHKLTQWKAFLGKNRLDAPPLDVVIAEIRQFIEQPLVLAKQKQETA
jgi:hypothetical protein